MWDAGEGAKKEKRENCEKVEKRAKEIDRTEAVPWELQSTL